MEGRLDYIVTGFASGNQTSTSVTESLNLARDLSAVNRKGMHMTTAKGVPLVYHGRLTLYRNITGDRLNSTTGAIIKTAQNNYVTRNAAVQLHAAREKMFSNAGIKKSDRGRYDKTIRYGWSAAGESYLLPSFTDGNSTFTDVGEWDDSIIAIDDDTSLVPTLFGPVMDETAAVSGDTFNLMNAYLNSRRKLDVDDLDAGDGAADHSIVRSMFNVEDATDDELQVIADDNQDQPPYDQDSAAGSFTSKASSQIALCGNLALVKDVIEFDAPFGLAELKVDKLADTAGTLDGDLVVQIEILGISEME